MAEPVCPLCAKPAQPLFAPFCSRRCQQIDLGRWLKGAYVIAGPLADPEKPGEDEA